MECRLIRFMWGEEHIKLAINSSERARERDNFHWVHADHVWRAFKLMPSFWSIANNQSDLCSTKRCACIYSETVVERWEISVNLCIFCWNLIRIDFCSLEIYRWVFHMIVLFNNISYSWVCNTNTSFVE